jgi:hypothetical protein
MGCPESIQSFSISPEPIAWPWCNLAASQRRPYCESVNSHYPVGLVSRQWDAVDWACVLCDRRTPNLLTFKGDFNFGKSQNSQRAKYGLWGGGGLTDLGDLILCQKKACTRAVEWAGALSWWSWSTHSVIVLVREHLDKDREWYKLKVLTRAYTRGAHTHTQTHKAW